LSKIAENIKTIIGEIVIITELFTGVDNSRPLKKASIFITIPKKEHAIKRGQSFFWIFSGFIRKLTSQKRIAAPKTLSKINPKGVMYVGITFLAIVWLRPYIIVAPDAAKKPNVLLSNSIFVILQK